MISEEGLDKKSNNENETRKMWRKEFYLSMREEATMMNTRCGGSLDLHGM
jgi:hypothetical protein